jgi:hypothetical protein
MTYYPDLGDHCMAGWGADVRAVGWLHPAHSFTTGPVPSPFLDLLQQHLQSAWNPFSFRGAHLCEFCPPPQRPRGTGVAATQESRTTPVSAAYSLSQTAPVFVSRILRKGQTGLQPATWCATCRSELGEDTAYCRECGSPKPRAYMESWGLRAAAGFRNLYIPTAAAVYIAPEMILHYVRSHGYRPPQEFVEAVPTCPAQDSSEFVALIERFQAPFDPRFFDRNAWAKREQSVFGKSLWTLRGLCAVCRRIIYSYDEQVPIHCEQPAVHVVRREG